jgi:hypothetical protein
LPLSGPGGADAAIGHPGPSGAGEGKRGGR